MICLDTCQDVAQRTQLVAATNWPHLIVKVASVHIHTVV